MARVSPGASPIARARDEAASKMMSKSSKEVRVNECVKIEDKARIFSNESNMQDSMEEIGESLGKDETKTRLPPYGREVVTNLGESSMFLITQIEIGKPAGTETGRGRDKEHTYDDFWHQNFGTRPYSNLHLYRTRVLGLLSTIAR